MLDPHDRYGVEHCLAHPAFQTEQLLQRNNRIPVKVIDTHPQANKKRKNETNENLNRYSTNTTPSVI